MICTWCCMTRSSIYRNNNLTYRIHTKWKVFLSYSWYSAIRCWDTILQNHSCWHEGLEASCIQVCRKTIHHSNPQGRKSHDQSYCLSYSFSYININLTVKCMPIFNVPLWCLVTPGFKLNFSRDYQICNHECLIAYKESRWYGDLSHKKDNWIWQHFSNENVHIFR